MISSKIKQLAQLMVDRPDLWTQDEMLRPPHKTYYGLLLKQWEDGTKHVFVCKRRFLFWTWALIWVRTPNKRDLWQRQWFREDICKDESKLLVKAVNYWKDYVKRHNEDVINSFGEDRVL